jgi:hypothetical protein
MSVTGQKHGDGLPGCVLTVPPHLVPSTPYNRFVTGIKRPSSSIRLWLSVGLVRLENEACMGVHDCCVLARVMLPSPRNAEHRNSSVHCSLHGENGERTVSDSGRVQYGPLTEVELVWAWRWGGKRPSLR